MIARNAGVRQSHRIDLRTAVGLGDVIVEPDDIYGHAVNLVARIETLARPGGICVSSETRRSTASGVFASNGAVPMVAS